VEPAAPASPEPDALEEIDPTEEDMRAGLMAEAMTTSWPKSCRLTRWTTSPAWRTRTMT